MVLHIDERAAQLTGLAPYIRHSREGMNSDNDLNPGDLAELKRLFAHATTFGSLIQVPEELALSLPALNQLSEMTDQDLFVMDSIKLLRSLVHQAVLLPAGLLRSSPVTTVTRFMHC